MAFAFALTAAHLLRCGSAMAFLALALSGRLVLKTLFGFASIFAKPANRARACWSLAISLSISAMIDLVSISYRFLSEDSDSMQKFYRRADGAIASLLLSTLVSYCGSALV